MSKRPNEKTDRRVVYTKMFLKEGLMELMKEKPVDKITPTELCRHAQINRNTFYTHYYSPRDVLEEIEAEFSSQIMESIGTKLSAIGSSEMIKEICLIIYDQREFCKILLSENGDPDFLENVISIGKLIIVQDWRDRGVNLDDEKMDFFFTFIIRGSISIIRKWAATDMKSTPVELAELINNITNGAIEAMTK